MISFSCPSFFFSLSPLFHFSCIHFGAGRGAGAEHTAPVTIKSRKMERKKRNNVNVTGIIHNVHTYQTAATENGSHASATSCTRNEKFIVRQTDRLHRCRCNAHRSYAGRIDDILQLVVVFICRIVIARSKRAAIYVPIK